MRNKGILQSIVLLIPFVFMFAFALDVYIPAVPEIMRTFNAGQETIQLTLSLFVLIIGTGQLFLGPLSDHFGRRLLIFISIDLFILGSILGAASFSIAMLITARIIQALGCCGMIVIVFAIVRDLFTEKEGMKVYSFLNCGLAISPLFAPIIGSYLDHWFFWRAEFIFLILLGLMVYCQSWLFIRETLPLGSRTKLNWNIFSRYWIILTDPIFFVYAFCATASIIIFFTFFSSSPYIVINLLHYPVKDFGFCFAFMGLTFFVGSLISGKIITRFGLVITMLIGMNLSLAGGLMMLIWYQISGISIYEFIIPSMLTGMGCAIILGTGAAGAMQALKMAAGSMAAVLGCMQFSSAALFGLIIMHWPVTSTMPLAMTIVILLTLSLMVFISHIIYVKYKKQENSVKNWLIIN